MKTIAASIYPGKVVTVLLLVCLSFMPLGTTSAQESVPPDRDMDAPPVVDDPGPIADPEIELDTAAEPPVDDEEPPSEGAWEDPNPQPLAVEAGSAQPTALNFQIPTQPQVTVDQSTGALVYEYPIELPEGRGGMTPQLSLKYDSRMHSRPDSIAGLGWEVSIPYIKREPVAGTQNLYTKPYFSSSISGNLIATTNTSTSPYTVYLPEIDQDDYLKYTYNSDNTWTVTGKKGKTYTFGGSSASRQDNPSDSSKAYKWMLSKIADANGNEIQYSYIKDSGQIYPSQILYTYHASSPAVNTVSFSYTAPSSYGATVYNPGFAATTYKLLNTITVTTPYDAQDSTVGTYTMGYVAAQSLQQKLLATITRTDSFASSAFVQPFEDRTSFSYSIKSAGWETGTHSLSSYLNSFDSTVYADIYTADFDANGYQDVMVSHYRSGGTPQQYNYLFLNSGAAFTESKTAWSLPMHDISEYHAIADLNGDRLPDLHPRGDAGHQEVYLNTGSGFTADTSGTWNIANYVPEAACGPNVGDNLSQRHNVFLHDINNDGKNDIVYFGGTSNFKVYLNDGSGWTVTNDYTFTATSSVTITSTCGLSPGYYQTLLDFNGDGLADYYHQNLGVFLNTGSGFARSAAYAIDTEIIERTGFADINGDNLIDYVSAKSYSGSTCVIVHMNNGAGFTLVNPASFPPCTNSNIWDPQELKYTQSDASLLGTLMDVNADGFPEVVGKLSTSVTYKGKVRAINNARNAWTANSTSAWEPIITPSRGVYFDINSDNVIDFIYPQTTWDGTVMNPSKVYMGKAAVPNRLTQITNALGAQTVVTYGTAPTDHDDTNVAPMAVIKMLTVQNVGHGQPTQVIQYAYAGGAYVIDPATGQRRFAGFHKVTATESGNDLAALRVTETYFHQANESDSPTSEPTDTSLALIGKPYYATVQHPSGTPKKETWQRYGTYTLATEPVLERLSTFAYPTETIVKTTESSATTGTAATYVYDTALGERTELRNLGFVTVGASGSYTDIPGDTRYQFTEYATNAASTIVKPSRIDLRTSPSPSDTVARTDYFYDSQPLGTSGSLGNLTRELTWISGSGAVAAETTYTHDVFGNVLTVTNPRGAVTAYTYDTTRSLVATTTNALGHTTAYEYMTGKLKKVTDPNSRITTYGYSSKGWLYSTTVANNAGNQRTRQFLDGTGSNWAIESYTQPVNAREDQSWQSLDNLRRPVRLVRRLLNHTTGAPGGFYLKEARAYDALGREITRSAPYGVPDPSNYYNLFTVSVPATLVSTTTYDIFDRPLSIVNALGTTTVAYAGPEITTIDANGKMKRTKTDAYGNLTEVKEYNGTSTHTTRYAYDARNLLTGVTDALGNIRGFTYNHAGWLTHSEDLHAPEDATFGTTAFTYDAAGNQLTETQPNGTVVTRVFDLLDRPISIDGSSTAAADFTLTYDSCTKGAGRLCGVSGAYSLYGLTLSKSFVYGASMPVSTTIVTLEKTFTTSYQYTLSDEISRITHPDGTSARYAFGDWALPSTVYVTLPGGAETTYATATYHHTLQPETIAVSNGPTLSYAYDGNKLYRKANFSAAMGTTTLQSYAYAYDNLNNVTQVIEPGLTKAYAYDDLSRLIQAVHTPSGGSSTTYTYAYDAIGNITSANGTAYAYSGTGKTNPHAVTSIGSDLYAYDENGNAVTAPNQIIAYNWQNQPASVTTGTTATVFAYDETAERFFYQTPATTEIQVSEEYLVRGDRYLVGSSTSEVTVKLGKTPIGLVTGGVIYSTITDHLGTPVKQVNASGTVVESTSYGPFGAVLATSGTITSKRGYTGHEEDADTGLVYAEARYYSPLSQRFLQQDPSHVYLGHQNFQGLIGADRKQILSDPQQLNFYAYSRNNPLRYIDPSGLFNVNTGEIERGDYLGGIRNQINEQYGTSLTAGQIARANGIQNKDKIYAGNYIALPGKDAELRFDNKSLQVYDKRYSTAVPILSWSGVSGNNGHDPIPEGKWTADPSRTESIYDISIWNYIGSWASPILGPVRQVIDGNNKVGYWPGGEWAWGTQRTELGNSIMPHTRFYIHGGWFPGSAGCIDLTSNNKSFQSWLGSYGKSVNIIVDY